MCVLLFSQKFFWRQANDFLVGHVTLFMPDAKFELLVTSSITLARMFKFVEYPQGVSD